MSALPPKADMCSATRHVRFGPEADIGPRSEMKDAARLRRRCCKLIGAFAMKQWKVALSLAILGAIAAPFVTHTVRMRPATETWIPLTQDEKERISAEMSKTSNCRTLSEQFDAKKTWVLSRQSKTLWMLYLEILFVATN